MQGTFLWNCYETSCGAKGIKNDKLSVNSINLSFTSTRDKSHRSNPEVYKYALKQLGVSANESVAVENTKANQSAANLCGINCCIFPGEYATIGYDDTSGNNFLSERLDLLKIVTKIS